MILNEMKQRGALSWLYVTEIDQNDCIYTGTHNAPLFIYLSSIKCKVCKIVHVTRPRPIPCNTGLLSLMKQAPNSRHHGHYHLMRQSDCSELIFISKSDEIRLASRRKCESVQDKARMHIVVKTTRHGRSKRDSLYFF